MNLKCSYLFRQVALGLWAFRNQNKKSNTTTLALKPINCITSQEMAPVRVEVDVKFGGIQCNLMISRLAPLLSLCPAKKTKPPVPQEESISSTLSTCQGDTEDSEQKAKPIIWNATGSAPEITIILFSTNDSSLFRVKFLIFTSLLH